ncbi:MAG: right-handed parallel beta-helix repeat-containing protein [Methanophagales archaeon]|nr:right-handed parallel beta-helix repeat-containing protein [Methanophagales archaeon]
MASKCKVKMGRIGKIVIPVFFIFFMLFIAGALDVSAASTIVVNKTSPACTTGDYYCDTIQGAVEMAEDGDTIVVCPGTYVENIEVDKSLTIRSENGPDSTIVQTKGPENHVFNVTADYVKISGFTIKGAIKWGCWSPGINLYDADYCLISNNNCRDNWISIALKKSNNNSISDNNCDNFWDCISLYDSNNNSIFNNNCSHSVRGIELGHSNNNSIFNNNCSSNVDEGIYLINSNNNSISNNDCSLTSEESIFLIDSNNNSISNNKCTNNKNGICMISSSNNTIRNNLIKLNDNAGISLSNCYKNTIEENIISGNEQFAVSLNNSSFNTIRNNTIKSNYQGIFLSLSNNNIVEGNTVLENTGYGIELNKSHDNSIKNNDVKSNYIGDIGLLYSNNSTIEKNTAFDSLFGISVWYSNDNTIKDNTLKSNRATSLTLEGNKNTVEKNVVSDNFRGIDLTECSNNIIKNNIVKSNIVYGIRSKDSNNKNIIKGNIVFNNDGGIQLDESEHSIIRDNIIKSNKGGIYLHSSNFTHIYNNDISMNGYGVILDSRNGSQIYHNNIIDNGVMEIFDLIPETRNYWFNYLSLEGNYWSDYKGADDGSGIGKHAIAGDGIGDTNIPYPKDGYDFYPFINKDGWLTLLVSPDYWDFGTVYQGDIKPKQTFEIQNRGKDELTIFNITSDNDVEITGIKFPTNISVDNSMTFNVTIDTKNLEGDILRSIEIITNDKITPTKTILMYGFVKVYTPGVRVEKPEFESRAIKGQINLFQIRVNNTGVANETNITVDFSVGNRLLDSQEIPELKKNENKTVKFKWDTANASLGIHEIKIEVISDKGELLDHLELRVYVLPTTKVSTFIVTNLKRMAEKWGNDTISGLEEKLIELSFHPSVNGIIVRVENHIDSEIYKKWDGDKEPEKANEIANVIKGLIDSKLENYSNIEYLIIVGDDRIIPFYRIKDNTSKDYIGPGEWLGNEARYANPPLVSVSPPISGKSAVGKALSLNYYLTDDFYADFEQEKLPIELHIPDKPIGRLVETPEEIISTIDTFLTRYPVYPKRIFVTGCEFMSDGSSSATEIWKGIREPVFMVNSSKEINYNSSKEIVKEILNESNSIMAIFLHAAHYEFDVPPGKNVSDPKIKLAASKIYNSSQIEGAIVYAMSCHSGLNVPQEELNSLDLVQSFVQKGVLSYVAPTGYGMGGIVTVAGHEKLLEYFTENLCEGKEVGDSLISAKRDYYLNNFHMDYLDEKVISSTVLYGFPMYGIIAEKRGEEEEKVMVVEINPKEEIQGMQIEELEIYTLTLRPKLKPEDVSPECGKPILPMATWSYVAGKKKIHGITLKSANYTFTENVSRSIEFIAVSKIDPREWLPKRKNWYPSQFFKLNTLGEIQTMVIVTGQFNETGRLPDGTTYLGDERQFDELTFDIYLSPLDVEEEEKPIINEVKRPKEGNTTFVRVNATDNSGILKVIVTYTDKDSSNKEWVSIEAKKDLQKPNEYHCELEGDVEFFVQAVDIYGNVAIDDYGERYYP